MKLANQNQLAKAKKKSASVQLSDVGFGTLVNIDGEAWEALDFGNGPVVISEVGTLSVEGLVSLTRGQSCTITMQYRVAEDGTCWKRPTRLEQP